MDYSGDEHGDMDDIEERENAAWILSAMQKSKLDKATGQNLHEMVKKDMYRLLREICSPEPRQERTIIRSNYEVGQSSRADVVPTPAVSAATRPPFPQLQHLVGLCSEPLQKPITKSDVRKHLSRFMLNSGFFKEHLSPMLGSKEIIEAGIPVTLYGPDGRDYDTTLILWSGKYYVIKGKKWFQFCRDYALESLIGHSATIWMFRHSQTGGLCFAMTWGNAPELNHNHTGNSRKRTAAHM